MCTTFLAPRMRGGYCLCVIYNRRVRDKTMNNFLSEWGPLLARTALALLFIVSGTGMAFNFAGTAGFLGSLTPVPGVVMAALAILFKVGGGVALLVGWKAREAAWALIAFTLMAILLAHMNWADQNQMTQALKNLSIIGGLLMVVIHGPGAKVLGSKPAAM